MGKAKFERNKPHCNIGTILVMLSAYDKYGSTGPRQNWSG